ncbi:MAG: pyridoxamine 5'-phosphate oxidase family protein [Tannerellaceae bacterium]|jgi:nitroimidazol reductase NimA-like FMN-containing flavoprotein (pyridoxamine 5'-phosphate oxidase superfamily)|nr:pyridoxamine 5'-phosphate oxidase family protein [Tannerellaceae bacterium]
MRRKDKEITGTEEMIAIIEQNTVCRIGLSQNNRPYIVPLNYGYSFENNILTLYFHSAREGRKMDIIKENNQACFEIDCDHQLIEGGKPCSYSYAFKSIIGFGRIVIIESTDEKINGLNRIIKQQTGKEITYDFPEEALKRTVVYKLAVKEFTGKQKQDF